MSPLKNKLKTQIAQGKLDNVIQTLLTETNGQLHNDVVQLSSRFESFKQQKIQGILSHNEITLEQNKLTNTLLSIVNNLSEEVTNNSTKRNAENPLEKESNNSSAPSTPISEKSSWKKWLTIAAAILASLAAVAELSGYSLKDIFSDSSEQEALTLTVKVRAEDGTRPLKGEGDLVIDYGNGTQTIPIDNEGKIDLREIPSHLKGNTISIMLEHPKYEGVKSFHPEEAQVEYILNGQPITYLVQMKEMYGIVQGRVLSRDGNRYLENVLIEVDGETFRTDEYGKIYIKMPKQKWKEEYTVNATLGDLTKTEKYYPTIGRVEFRFKD